MRKIATKKDKEKKERRNQFIVGGILIFIMLFSVLGYSLQREDSGSQGEAKKFNYNGFEFADQNGFWVLQLGDFQFVFQNLPNETGFINEMNTNQTIKPLSAYTGIPLYVFSENDDAKWEVYRNLYPGYNPVVQRIQDACPENETNCEGDVPVKTCEDSFIIIRKSEEDKITQDNNCVFIEGKEEDLIKLTDEYLFRLIGVK